MSPKRIPFKDLELLRASRALATLTRATEALIRATDEQHLLNEICKILVDEGGYAFAWVGYVQNDDECSIWPVARYGRDNGFLAETRMSWTKGEKSSGPVCRAVRSAHPHSSSVHDDDFAPWRDSALKRGFQSTISLPLEVDGSVIGVVSLYSDDATTLDPEECQQLEKLARNLAWGIGMQRMQFERRRAAQELKESEERYRSLVQLSPDAILVHTQGIIIFSNSAADRLFCATPAMPLVGKRLFDLMMRQESSPATAAGDSQEFSGGAVENRLTRLDGSIFAAEVTAASIVFHGVQARQVVIRDISERKHVEAQLVQSAKLATLGEMAAGMAHELSQPINIIRMAAEGALMMIDRSRASADYQKKQFSLMAGQAARMADIIDHIRIFSRKDTSEVSIFDARDSVQLAVELTGLQMRSDDIAISVHVPEQPCPVRGRPVQLEQVIINLLTNAQDALKTARRQEQRSPAPAQIVVEAALVAQGLLSITVTDNGTGIDEDVLDRIFEPFFTTKEVGSGTGLGLSVSFGIISSMEGILEARNITPAGAEFSVTLPMVDYPTRTADGVASATPVLPLPLHEVPDRCLHILLVDDERQALATMAAFLREFGYRVSQAKSGNSAFRLFQSHPADLVITDIRMSDGNGIELARNLRKIRPALPIIVVTGHIDTTEGLEDIPLPALTVIKKPVSLTGMAEVIERLLHGR